MGRWVGIDHGTKRIGVAVASTSNDIASPVATIPAKPIDSAIAQIEKIVEQYQAEGIVVGWPLNMDGSEGDQAKLARKMASQLAEATALDVRVWDERLSSFEAKRSLAGLLTRKKRRARRDSVAAATILRDFLQAHGPQTAPRPEELE